MRLAALILAGLFALPASAAQVSERPDKVLLTVYHSGTDYERNDPREFVNPRPEDGLGFVTEIRTIDIPAGPATIELRGVASTIVPQTAMVEGLPGGVVERNFDYDLLSPGSLIAKSVGETVTLVRTNPKTGKRTEKAGVVKSGPGGVVLDFGDGTVEALQCSGLPEKLVFHKIPDGLRDSPTLSIRTNAPQAGRYTIKLHYLAAGLNWAANYVARVRPDGKSFDLSGWVTLMNASDTGFAKVPLDIVAGHLETDDDSRPIEAARVYMQTGCWPTDVRWWWSKAIWERLHRSGNLTSAMSMKRSSIMVEDSLETVTVTGFRAAIELGDYKLYSLGHDTDVLARQTKQISLLDQEDVPFERFYRFALDGTSDWHPAYAAVRFANTKQSHLGLPLPGGYITLTDDAILLGRANFGDTPDGAPAEFTLGEGQDVFVHVVEASREKTGGWFHPKGEKATYDVTIQNSKVIAVPFELSAPINGSMSVVSEPLPHVAMRYGLVWRLTLAPGETKTLRLVLEYAD
jgi:hypothetical protein